jgi:XRE family aerobic/anaerobic benzoate catabolism transcriptional regulator
MPLSQTARSALQTVARNVRALRRGQALTLRELAGRASVSERFLVSVEAGSANVSVGRLADIAAALGSSLPALVGDGSAPTARSVAREPVALLGLRGAGKTAIGQRVAARLGLPFAELDAAIAERAGMTLAELFSLHGVDYYRRLEARELDRVLSEPPHGIIATGGSIVTHHATYERLRRGSVTVFLRASAEDHWNRVVAQGDARPMANRSDAMQELRAMLRARRALYERADHVVDTSALGLERSVDAVVRIVRDAEGVAAGS